MKKLIAVLTLCVASSAFAQPTTDADLGVLTGDVNLTGSFAAGEVAWIRLELAESASAPLYVDFTSNDSTNPDASGADTEIALYDSIGDFLVTDDDDGIGLTSTLTFGAGSGLMLGDSFNLGGDGIADGEDGDLPAGVYYLAIGEFNTIYGANNWTIDAFGNEDVNYVLNVYTNTPEPAMLSVLALGGLVALRRRR